MMRRALILPLLIALAAPVRGHAQATVHRIGGGAQLLAYIESAQMLGGTPAAWRDSAFAAWRREVPDFPVTIPDQFHAGAQLEVVLRIRRNGDLDRVRLEGTTGSRAVDSALILAAHRADEGLKYPALPPTVEGAGRELRIRVAVPIPRVVRADTIVGDFASGMVDPTSMPSGVRFPSPTGACADSLARPTEYRDAAVGLTIATVPGGERWAEWALSVRQRLIAGWRPPTAPLKGAPPPIFREPAISLGATSPVSGTLRLRFDATGRLASATMSEETLFPEIDSSLIAAAWRADSSDAVPAAEMAGDPTILELRVSEGGTNTVRAGLGALAVPVWVPTLPSLVSPGRLRYPEALRSQRVGGRVVVEFVVGPNGRVHPASFRVLRTAHRDFEPEVRALIMDSRFDPAAIRSCPVPILVRQTINFNP